MKKHKKKNLLEKRNENRQPERLSETELLIRFLEKGYCFRYNEVMGYTEYHKCGEKMWLPVDARVINTLTMLARLDGINVWNHDTLRYVDSQMIKVYNPVIAYLEQVRGCWDGQDHIGKLAATVRTTCPQWETWFRRWMLAVVAQWMHLNPKYGNAVAPLLISGQGFNKSTFCKSLLPKELSWGYIDSLQLAEKKQTLQAMNQMLLINLDEFNQINTTIQSGFLKNIIQLSTIKIKRPYGKHVEEFPRLASFIATTNMSDVLTDPTGNRRFIAVELTEPVNISQEPEHKQLYAQILALLDKGERYWFDAEETKAIMDHNRKYQMKSSTETFFEELFEITSNEQIGEYMTAAAIYDYVRRHAGSQLPTKNIIHFGRTLANINGIVRRRGKHGSEYLVVRK